MAVHVWRDRITPIESGSSLGPSCGWATSTTVRRCLRRSTSSSVRSPSSTSCAPSSALSSAVSAAVSVPVDARRDTARLPLLPSPRRRSESLLSYTDRTELKWTTSIQRWSAICRVWPWKIYYQKSLSCISSQGQDLYPHQKLNMYIYWFPSESGYRRRRQHAERHSTITRATYRQLILRSLRSDILMNFFAETTTC